MASQEASLLLLFFIANTCTVLQATTEERHFEHHFIYKLVAHGNIILQDIGTTDFEYAEKTKN